MQLFRKPIIRLTNQQQKELLWRYRNDNDRQAYEKLVLSCARMVFKIALKAYRSSKKTFKPELEDLCQEGLEGLVCAIEAFKDPRKQTNFSSFASKYIKSNVWRHVRRSDLVDRKIDSIARKGYTKIFYNIGTLINIVNTWDPEIKQKERGKFANRIKVPIDVIIEAEKRWCSKVVYEDSELLSSQQMSAAKQMDIVKLQGAVCAALSRLDQEYKVVIENKFFSDNPKTILQLAKELGTTRSIINTRKSMALTLLKDQFDRSQIIKEFIST